MYKYMYSNQIQQPSLLTAKEFAAIRAQPNCARESYTDTRYVGEKALEIEVFEIYGHDETDADYPDGDPFAAVLCVAPRGYGWNDDGSLYEEEPYGTT